MWANLQEHKKTKQLIGDLSDYVKQHAYLSKAGDKVVDIGFAKLHAAVLDIPKALKSVRQPISSKASLSTIMHVSTTLSLKTKKNRRKKSLVRSLVFAMPSFPQSFRVLRQTGKGQRLEDEETWPELAGGTTWARSAELHSSPYSSESPLLIPRSSGKWPSFSRLCYRHNLSITLRRFRVPLREVCRLES